MISQTGTESFTSVQRERERYLKTFGANGQRILTAWLDFVNLFIHMPILVFSVLSFRILMMMW